MTMRGLLLGLALVLSTSCAPSVRDLAMARPAAMGDYSPPEGATLQMALDRLTAKVGEMGVGVQRVEESGGLVGRLASHRRVIYLSSELGVDASFEVLAHEAGHLFHPSYLTKSMSEVFAETIAWKLALRWGYDMRRSSGRYLASYKDGLDAERIFKQEIQEAVEVLLGAKAIPQWLRP